MKKRDFLKTGAIFTAGALIAPLSSCSSSEESKDQSSNTPTDSIPPATTSAGEFTLPELPYAEDALEPYIDKMTMNIHHGKHHAGYVKKLNKALQGHPLAGKDLDSIVTSVSEDDADTGVRNNGGGHYNHSLFWKIMKPGGGEAPTGDLAKAIDEAFGSYDAFKEEFAKAAATRFGSGWAWLALDKDGKLFVSSTPNQDNPMMLKIVEKPGIPVLGIDVWEHAYYLHYQNRRKEYIDNFFKIINWEGVAENYTTAKGNA